MDEEINEEGSNKENYSGETDKIVVVVEVMPICLNWGRIFGLPNERLQHMVIALQHPKIYAERAKGVIEMSETPIQCVSKRLSLL